MGLKDISSFWIAAISKVLGEKESKVINRMLKLRPTGKAFRLYKSQKLLIDNIVGELEELLHEFLQDFLHRDFIYHSVSVQPLKVLVNSGERSLPVRGMLKLIFCVLLILRE